MPKPSCKTKPDRHREMGAKMMAGTPGKKGPTLIRGMTPAKPAKGKGKGY